MNTPPRSALPRHFVLLLSSLTALTALSIDMSLPALDLLRDRFHPADGVVQLTLSLFLIGYGVGQLVCGPLSDRYGRRPLLLLGLAMYVATSLGCAFAPSLPVLIAMRFLQGIGGSVGPILARAMVRDCFETKDSSRVLSQITQVMVIAPLVAPTIGGLLLSHFEWHSIFFVLAASGTGLLLMSFFAIPETRPPLPAATVPAGGDGAAAAAAGASSLWGGVRLLFTTPATLTNLLAIYFVGSGMFAYISASPFIIMEVYGVPRAWYGAVFALAAGALMAGATANRYWLGSVGSARLLKRGAGSAVGLLLCVWGGVGGLAGVMVPMMGYIFGVGMLAPNATAAAMEPHPHLAGLASSLLGAAQTLGSALAAYLVGVFYNGTAGPVAVTVAISGVVTLAVLRLRPGWAAVEPSPAMAQRAALEEELVE